MPSCLLYSHKKLKARRPLFFQRFVCRRCGTAYAYRRQNRVFCTRLQLHRRHHTVQYRYLYISCNHSRARSQCSVSSVEFVLPRQVGGCFWEECEDLVMWTYGKHFCERHGASAARSSNKKEETTHTLRHLGNEKKAADAQTLSSATSTRELLGRNFTQHPPAAPTCSCPRPRPTSRPGCASRPTFAASARAR